MTGPAYTGVRWLMHRLGYQRFRADYDFRANGSQRPT